jgi:hypothetical protein
VPGEDEDVLGQPPDAAGEIARQPAAEGELVGEDKLGQGGVPPFGGVVPDAPARGLDPLDGESLLRRLEQQFLVDLGGAEGLIPPVQAPLDRRRRQDAAHGSLGVMMSRASTMRVRVVGCGPGMLEECCHSVRRQNPQS